MTKDEFLYEGEKTPLRRGEDRDMAYWAGRKGRGLSTGFMDPLCWYYNEAGYQMYLKDKSREERERENREEKERERDTRDRERRKMKYLDELF